MQMTGHCYCGDIHYEIDGDIMMKGQCHCRECQYLTGGGPNFFLMVGSDGFKYTKGQPSQYRREDLPKAVTREFCGKCGSQIVTRPLGFPAVVVKVGTLDNPAAFEKAQVAIYTKDAQPFHVIAEGIPQFEAMPDM